MPTVPVFIAQSVWSQFAAVIPPVVDEHPWGCRRPHIPDRVVCDKLVQGLMLGAVDDKISDSNCSATTIRRRPMHGLPLESLLL